MKKKLRRFESILWLTVKLSLYLTLLGTFIYCLGLGSHSLRALSRTLGITLTTFIIVGLLFLNVYGKYDIGRRKSKPIIRSMSFAILFTDIITYLQLMIMRTNKPDIRQFQLDSIGALIMAFVLQMLILIFYAYAGNTLFFKIHNPERCCIITSSQKSLDKIARVMSKYKKQYSIDEIYDYKKKDILMCLKKIDTVFLIDVPVSYRGEIVQYCYKNRINIYFNPEIEDVVEMNSEYYVLEDMSLLNANVKSLTMEQRIVKRILDLMLAIVLGILTMPVWLVTAIVIKANDGGSVLFKQKRATINGNVFEVYKFRTMKENVENKSVTEGDSRITRPGNFLRRTRIDELPQLYNILKGDMTFVGPRPEMLENVSAYTKKIPEFRYRMRVKAGLTGYAQIFGKYNTTPKEKLIMDMMYIEQFSIWKDIQLIFQTFIVFLKKDSTEAFADNQKSEYIFREYVEEEKR
ncbi:MAG: sugar transferase [Lachnospiraceae bacterium]|nr:sugar transferase [Lachnospiraceae bacterium]